MMRMTTAALLLCPALVLAGEPQQPYLEAKLFFISQGLDPAIPGGSFYRGTTGDETPIARLKGVGGGARLALSLGQGFRLQGELSRTRPERSYASRDVNYEVEQTHGRAGLRFTATADSVPVYAEAGADFARYLFDDKAQFGASYSEAEAGEDPAQDADTVADPRAFRGKRKASYGLAHVATGYRGSGFHGFLDVGYGLGKSDDLLELTVGTGVNLTRNVQVLGEYRASRLEDSDGDIKINEIRLGLGLSF